MHWLSPKVLSVRYVGHLNPNLGVKCPSITTMQQTLTGDCYAPLATLELDSLKTVKKFY